MLLSLADLKLIYYRQIDLRTQEVLARGFTYSGVNVSLSTAAQVRYEAMKDLTNLLASITIEAADDTQPPLVLTTLLAIGAFVDAERAYVRTIWADANALKKQVRDATTQAAVEAVVDTR